MKKLLTLTTCLFLLLSLSSCSNDRVEVQEESKLSEIQKSNDFKLFSENYPDLSSKIDYSSFSEGEKNGVKAYGMLLKNNDKISGRITFVNKNDNYTGIIELFKYNSNNKIIEFEYKNVYNETLITLDAIENPDKTFTLKLQNKSFNKNSLSKRQLSWWDCFSGALDACFDDFDCGMTCGILAGVCIDAIAIACVF